MSHMAAFIYHPKNTRYDGKDEDEQILYVLRRSHITNIWWVIFTGVMGVLPLIVGPYLTTLTFSGQPVIPAGFVFAATCFWYLVTFGVFLFNFVNWYFNVYIITSKKIIDFDFYGLTYKNIAETTLDNVEDVTSQIAGSFNMIFNIGDVFIQTAGEKREFDFMHIDDPGKVRDIISDLVAQRKGRHHANN